MNAKQSGWMIVMVALAVMVAMVLAGCSTPITTETTEPALTPSGNVVLSPDGKVLTKVTKIKKESNWPLSGKGFTMHQNAFFLKVETTGSAQTGSMFPNVDLAAGDNYCNDIPMARDLSDGANYSEYLHIGKSAWPWVSQYANIDYDRKSAGTDAPAPSVKIQMTADVTSGSTATAVIPAITPNTPITEVIAEQKSPTVGKITTTKTVNMDQMDAAIKEAAGTNLSSSTNLDVNAIAKQVQDWLAKPENQAQAKSWLSQAWSWISGMF